MLSWSLKGSHHSYGKKITWKRPAKGTRKLQIWRRITNLSGTFTKRFYWGDSNNVEFLCLELCKISVSLSFTSRISPLKVCLVCSKGLNIWSLPALINPVSRKQMCVILFRKSTSSSISPFSQGFRAINFLVIFSNFFFFHRAANSFNKSSLRFCYQIVNQFMWKVWHKRGKW